MMNRVQLTILMMVIFTYACQNNQQSLREKELDLQIKQVELEKEKLKNTRNDELSDVSRASNKNNRPELSQPTPPSPPPPPSDFYARGAGRYPEGSTRRIGYADIQQLSNYDLRIMRNEIFARHGYIFKSQDLIDYFSNQSWYRPIYTDVMSKLSSVEKENINYIQSFEK